MLLPTQSFTKTLHLDAESGVNVSADHSSSQFLSQLATLNVTVTFSLQAATCGSVMNIALGNAMSGDNDTFRLVT